MPHICIATTPAHRMETRAHVQTGRGMSADDAFVRAKNPYLVTFDEWRSSFDYVAADEWKRAVAADAPSKVRRKLRERFRRLEAWSGEVYVLGHSHDLANLCVGGFASTKSVPEYHHGLVSGAAFGRFLRDVLPIEKAAVLDVVLLAPWLGNVETPRNASFLADALTEIGAPATRALVHATRFETWPGAWDDVHVNGARSDRPVEGGVHPDPFAALRADVLAHAEKGTLGSRRVVWDLDREHRRVVEKQELHDVGVPVKSLEDVAFVSHLAQRGSSTNDAPRVFGSFFLDDAGTLREDVAFAVYAEHRRVRIGSAARFAGRAPAPQATPVFMGPASSDARDDVASRGVERPSEGVTGRDAAREERGSPEVARDPTEPWARPLPATSPSPVEVAPARSSDDDSTRSADGASKGREDEGAPGEGPTPVDDLWDWSSVRRKRPPKPMGLHGITTVEGFNEVPQRVKYDDLQQAREVGVEGPFMQKHAWQRERSFWESSVVEIEGGHAAPDPRRFNQLMRDHDETDPGHVTLPIRAWDLEHAPRAGEPRVPRKGKPPEDFDEPKEKKDDPSDPPPIDDPTVDPPPKHDEPKDPEWVPGSLSLSLSGDVGALVDGAAASAVRGRVCKGVKEADVAAAASALAREVDRALRDAASETTAEVPSAALDVKLLVFDEASVRKAVSAQVAPFANGAKIEGALAGALSAFVTSLGAEMKALSLTASARGSRPKSVEAPAANEGSAGGAGLEELSSAFFSYTWKDAWANDAPDPKVRANSLLDDASFKRCFRSGANDYFKVASHVANALSKTKQRLEIRVYHHPERRAVGEARAAALKKLWEYEQKLKGGGQEETFSKKAWLKTVAISIRFIPRTDPNDRNIITFAVGGAATAKPVPAAPAPKPSAIAWDPSSFVLRAEWACCTVGHGSTSKGSPSPPKVSAPPLTPPIAAEPPVRPAAKPSAPEAPKPDEAPETPAMAPRASSPQAPAVREPPPVASALVVPAGAHVLDVTTVSQGGKGGAHEHDCYLAACLTIQNFLTKKSLTMDEGWKLIGREAPPRDRIRTTFTKLKLPASCTYMAAVSYTAAEKQLALIAQTIRNGWPVMLGVGPKTISTAKVGHYAVVAGVTGERVPKQLLILDPWDAPEGDRGAFAPVPAATAPCPALRASKGWSILEVYFPKDYAQRRP